MSHYSPFFEVIHDEQKPVGSLGRGTHYSVFQYPSWTTETGLTISKPRRHRFAVIWDEDHDTRVISILDKLYLAGLLTSIIFIGERKGSLTVIVSSLIDSACKQKMQSLVEEVTSSVMGDYWPIDICSLGETGSIINDKHEKVLTYLANLMNIWFLGVFEYS